MRYYLPPTKNKVKRTYKPFQRFGIFYSQRRFKQQHLFTVFHHFLFWMLLALFGRIGHVAFGSLAGASKPIGLKVELPGAKNNDITIFKKNSNIIFLFLDRQNSFVCNSIIFPIQDLSIYLNMRYKENPDLIIILKADQKAEMEYVLQIREQVQKSRFDTLIYSTIQL